MQGDLDRASREALLHSLRAMGYVEGQNLVIEYCSGGGTFARLPALATGLVRLPVEVLVAQGVAAFAAKEATSTLLIVFVGVVDPVDRGLIASWPQPGGNITGAAGPVSTSMLGNRRAPQGGGASRHPHDRARQPGPSPLRASRQKLQAPARQFQVDLHFMAVRDPATELERVFATLAPTHIEALCVIGDMSFLPHRARMVELVAASRLPATYLHRPYVQAGGLMSSTGPPGYTAPCGYHGRQNTARRETGGHTRRVANEVRADHQPQDRQGIGDHDAPFLKKIEDLGGAGWGALPALGVDVPDGISSIWIGPHADYDTFIA